MFLSFLVPFRSIILEPWNEDEDVHRRVSNQRSSTRSRRGFSQRAGSITRSRRGFSRRAKTRTRTRRGFSQRAKTRTRNRRVLLSPRSTALHLSPPSPYPTLGSLCEHVRHIVLVPALVYRKLSKYYLHGLRGLAYILVRPVTLLSSKRSFKFKADILPS